MQWGVYLQKMIFMRGIKVFKDMSSTVFIITGYLASGKTAFSRRLARELGIPCINKDEFIKILNRNGAVLQEQDKKSKEILIIELILYNMRVIMEAGYSFIVEGVFVDAETINGIKTSKLFSNLIHQYNYMSVVFTMKGNFEVLHERFLEREKTLERVDISTRGLFENYEVYKRLMRRIDFFYIGGLHFVIDTTEFDKPNWDRYIEMARLYINA